MRNRDCAAKSRPIQATLTAAMALFVVSSLRADRPAPTSIVASAEPATRARALPDTWPISLPVAKVPDDFKTVFKAAETNDVRISAAIHRLTPNGHPIELTLTLKNQRKEEVFFNHTLNESDFYLRLIDQEGVPVPMTTDGERWLSRSLYVQTVNAGMTLKPGDSITRRYDLKNFFQISKVGPYRLSVVKTVNGTSSFPVAGDELEVDIDSIVFGVSD